eukprot:15466017-Alexandrium_andersonii.AAC.1
MTEWKFFAARALNQEATRQLERARALVASAAAGSSQPAAAAAAALASASLAPARRSHKSKRCLPAVADASDVVGPPCHGALQRFHRRCAARDARP